MNIPLYFELNLAILSHLYCLYEINQNSTYHILFVCAKRLEWWTLVITSKVLRRNHNLIDCYGISVSQMTTYKFHLSQDFSNINRHGFIPKCAMARQWLFDISYLLRRFTHDSYAWWTHEIISYNHGIYSFILVYFVLVISSF
jgi:hypothetical protein